MVIPPTTTGCNFHYLDVEAALHDFYFNREDNRLAGMGLQGHQVNWKPLHGLGFPPGEGIFAFPAFPLLFGWAILTVNSKALRGGQNNED